LNVRETLRHGSDYESGCKWVTWTRPGADADLFHFYAEVKQITMVGSVREVDPPCPDVVAIDGIYSTAAIRYMYEHKKDLAGHIWAVAVHHPDRQITVAQDGRPTSLPWDLQSLHDASGNAKAKGKRVWSEELQPKLGAFHKFDTHYGLARYLYVPTWANPKVSSIRLETDVNNLIQQRAVADVPQVRIERIQVQTRDAMLAQFVPAAAITYDKPFQPLCPGRGRAPRLPRVESELQELFDDAGERVWVGEEQEDLDEELTGATRVASSMNNVSSFARPDEALHSNPPQIYEQWAAGPRSPPRTPPRTPTMAPTRASGARSPPAAPKKRYNSLGAGIADITKKLRSSTIARHSKRRVTAPTVDARGSPIERTDRRVFTSGPAVPVLRLDTPGRVSIPSHQHSHENILFANVSVLFFRHTGRLGDSHVDSNGQQSHENVTFPPRLPGLFLLFGNGRFLIIFFAASPALFCFVFERRGGSLLSAFPFPGVFLGGFWWVWA